MITGASTEVLLETLLERPKIAVLSKPFDSLGLRTIGLDGKSHTGPDRVAIHPNGTRTTPGGIAPNVRTSVPKFFPEHRDKQCPRLDGQLVVGPIYN